MLPGAFWFEVRPLHFIGNTKNQPAICKPIALNREQIYYTAHTVCWGQCELNRWYAQIPAILLAHQTLSRMRTYWEKEQGLVQPIWITSILYLMMYYGHWPGMCIISKQRKCIVTKQCVNYLADGRMVCIFPNVSVLHTGNVRVKWENPLLVLFVCMYRLWKEIIAGTDSSRSIRTVEVCPGTNEQMFPYLQRSPELAAWCICIRVGELCWSEL